MKTLIPTSARGTAQPLGKRGRVFGFGLTPLAMALFAGGFLLAIPAFFHPQRIWFVPAWDGMVLLVALLDAWRLPRPESMTVTRSFVDSPQLGTATRIELAVRHEGDGVIDVRVQDDLHAALIGEPVTHRIELFPREDVLMLTTVSPRERGDFRLGKVFLRYRGTLKLVERWAATLPGGGQPVRIFPAHEDGRGNQQFYLLRARQIEMQRRKLQLRGVGRDFDSLREYQQGDELRNISWTATARRGRLVTRQFTVERSQQVWMVLDAGRLSRTGFEMRREGAALAAETDYERERAHRLTVTQLDQATTAATMLAQVIQHSGDKFAMMSYGREVKQVLMPGAGSGHMRLLIDLLSQTHSEAAEADPLHAVARLKTLQKRRGLIVWVTEMMDSAGRPEIVTAATELVRRHLVVLVLMKHPELDALAAKTPATREEMFHITAAQEMLERRRETIAQLERQGVLIVETTAEEVGVATVSQYLEVKAKGML